MTSAGGHGENLWDSRCLLDASSGKLLFDRIDDAFRRGGIEVEGGAYRRSLGFKRERFVNCDGNELLKKSSNRGRVDLLCWQRVSEDRRAIRAGRWHTVTVGELMWTVVWLRTTKI